MPCPTRLSVSALRLIVSTLPILSVGACTPNYHDDAALIDISGQPETYTGPATVIAGRYGTSDTGAMLLSWAGTQIETRFSGTTVTANMRLKNSQPQNFYQVAIDGNVTEIRAINGNQVSQVFTADSDGPHTLTLTKKNEPMDGLLEFSGFDAGANGTLMPTRTPSGRRIEFIGDSITCGYGNEGNITTQMLTSSQDTTKNSLRSCSDFIGKKVYEVSNAYQAFGPQVARAFGAEYRQICWSGKGVYRNADNTQEDLMPQVWPRSVATDGNTHWDTSQWIPQAVVIDLGTNDFGSVAQSNSGGPPNVETFKKNYLSLVRSVRRAYPDAWIILAVGPMLSDYYPTTFKALTTMRQATNSILGTLDDARIQYFEFPLNINSDLDTTGCEWHPNVAQDTNMARNLTIALQKYLGWKL